MLDSVKQGPRGWMMRGPGPQAGEAMTAHSAAVPLVGCVGLPCKQGHGLHLLRGDFFLFYSSYLFSNSAHLAVWVDENY